MDTKRIQGLQVITLAGVKVGTVDQIFVDPTTKHVTGFGLLADFTLPDAVPAGYLDAADVHALGADALTLPETTAVRGTVTAAHRDTLIEVSDLAKWQVVTEGGTLLGQIASIDVDPQTLHLARIEVSPGFFKSNKWIEAEQVTRLGVDAVMVADAIAVPEAAMPPLETTSAAEAAMPPMETTAGWPATIDRGTAPQRKERTMTSAAQNRIAGTVDDAKGRGKLAVGELIDNEDLKAAGRTDRATGAVKQAVADAKDKLDEVVTTVTGH